ncbi:glycosyltransferase family 2 protein [Proteiniphilum sp. UBA5259]|uniref:glycosyltransferase family 2 protein n=1 Tax=Proteiniphilum sp. UBA5259 TaxID=1947269 RepID=UPI000E93E04F|nr:glycosyltransferase family 2 protein [Proteiniphilum sp. UBA5259]HBG58498.1 dolichol-phosphate mannosyltransferase [Porphyromonadaceae bacterium]
MKNSTADYRFTIIVPVYNEEENIYSLEEKLRQFLSHSLFPTCVLFADDGSKDDSLQRIQEICTRNTSFFYIRLKKNGGLSAALKAGIDHTFSEYVGYMDADLQTDPEDFNLLLQDIARYEMVTGIRANRKDSFFKNLQSKIANGYRRMMTHDGISDTGCPLKVMHTEVARRIPFFNGMHRFLPALILLQNGRVKQTPVRHYPRMAGTSKYHLWNRLSGPFVDCFAYRWMKKRYINYDVNAHNLNS